MLRERVRARIDAAGSSQRKIETENGWSSGTLSRVFGGRKAVDAELLGALAKAIGAEPRELVAETSYASLLTDEPSVALEDRETIDAPTERAVAPSGSGVAAPSGSAPSRKQDPQEEPAPEVIEKPKAKPEVEKKPKAKPEVVEEPEAEPEIEKKPEPEPEVGRKTEPAPEAGDRPEAGQVAAAEPEAGSKEAAPAPGGVRGFLRGIVRRVWGG